MNTKVVLQTQLPNLKFVKSGKVRDIYDLGEYFLIVSTDRLSAFDVIMGQGIPNKGKVLTKISEFWFSHTENIIGNHLITTNINEFPKECLEYAETLEGRSMLVKKAVVVPFECIVRGYISGSGWSDYKQTGAISGHKLPEGMKESEKFEKPLFTPSTKADLGDHDENVSIEKMQSETGVETAQKLSNAAISVYEAASDFALSKGIILADTKMEFGFYEGNLIIVDELLTPDSSRFWPLDKYSAGRSQESYDKQFVRDYLISVSFNKQPPPPVLPGDVILKTSEKYLDVLYKLTGETL